MSRADDQHPWKSGGSTGRGSKQGDAGSPEEWLVL